MYISNIKLCAHIFLERVKKRTQKSVLSSFLVSTTERSIASAACLCGSAIGSLPSVLLVGLKCGTLAGFIHKYMVGTAVEVWYCISDVISRLLL